MSSRAKQTETKKETKLRLRLRLRLKLKLGKFTLDGGGDAGRRWARQ